MEREILEPKGINLSLEMNKPGSSHKLDNIPLLDVKASAGEVKNLAKPFRGWLSKKSGINKTKVLAHTRLDNLESENEIMYLRALISRKKIVLEGDTGFMKTDHLNN